MITKMDRLFNNKPEQSYIDKLFGIVPYPVYTKKFIKHYENPDMFYLDKTAGIMPKGSLIDESGNVYLIANAI